MTAPLHFVQGSALAETPLADSGSMARHRDEVIAAAYRQARRKASRETRLSIGTFPADCPYTWGQIMETPYEIERN